MIEADFPIKKVSDRVFLLDFININEDFLISFCKILDLGMKFVPTFSNHINLNFFRYFLNNLDCNLYNFNKYLFFSKNKFNTNREKACNNSQNSFLNHIKRYFSKNNDSNIIWQHETLCLRKLMHKSNSKKPFSNV